MRVLLTPGGEVNELYLPVLGGRDKLHGVALLILYDAKAHRLELVVAVVNALAQRVEVYVVKLDVEAGSDIQQFVSAAR